MPLGPNGFCGCSTLNFRQKDSVHNGCIQYSINELSPRSLCLSESVLDCFCLRGESIMAASAASREVFTEGVRAVLSTWPVLQVNTAASASAGGRAGRRTDGQIELRLTRFLSVITGQS